MVRWLVEFVSSTTDTAFICVCHIGSIHPCHASDASWNRRHFVVLADKAALYGACVLGANSCDMVFRAVFGCNNRSQTKEKLQSNAPDPRFFKMPKVRLNECEQTRVLSKRRR